MLNICTRHLLRPVQKYGILKFEITEKLQILRNSNRTQVHGRPPVIVYTWMCTSIVLLILKKIPN